MRAGMAGEALVAVQVDLIAVDRMRDDGRLLRIVPHLLFRRIAHRRHRRRGTFIAERSWPAPTGIERWRGKRAGADRDRDDEEEDRCCPDHGRYTFSTRTAHFLKSA